MLCSTRAGGQSVVRVGVERDGVGCRRGIVGMNGDKKGGRRTVSTSSRGWGGGTVQGSRPCSEGRGRTGYPLPSPRLPPPAAQYSCIQLNIAR